jgi:hypothetical protein
MTTGERENVSVKCEARRLVSCLLLVWSVASCGNCGAGAGPDRRATGPPAVRIVPPARIVPFIPVPFALFRGFPSVPAVW